MTTQKKNKVLVAYFSWSGNTRKVANQIHQFVGGDIFEIQPVEDYPTNYNAVLDLAKKEIRSGNKPELKEKLASIEEYNTVFVGYPNWWNTFPAPVATFLAGYNFNKKTIIPFCTHGGGGMGHSVSDIVKQCPESAVMNRFSINGNAASNNTKVEKWVEKLLETGVS